MARRLGRDGLDGIAVFVKVAQSVSFTEAARRLGLSASGVSRAITRLESRLGVRLIDRTTRRLSLSAEGAAFFERCRQILDDLEDAEAAVAEIRSTPRGLLRIQVPRGFGRTVIVPALAGYLERYPEVSIDVVVNDGAVDPAESGVDASLVLGEPEARQFVARKLCAIGYAVCAAPAYLERHGEPKSPDDLIAHRCLNYVQPRSGRTRDWTLSDGGRQISVPVSSVLDANDIHAILQAANAGAGLAYLMDFLIADDVKAGRLKIVMPGSVHRGVPVYVCYPRNRYPSLRLTAFVEYLDEALGPAADWSIDRLIPAGPKTHRTLNS